MNRPLRRLIAGLLALTIASTAHADLIGYSSATDRERIAAFLDRDDVAAQFASHGVAATDAKARVAALTDAEAAALAGRIASAPAGGSPGILVVGLLIYVVVPIVGGLAIAAAGIVTGVNYVVEHSTTAPRPEPLKTTEASLPFPASGTYGFPASGTYGSFIRSATAPYAEPSRTTGASSPFPASTGLYGSFVPASSQASVNR